MKRKSTSSKRKMKISVKVILFGCREDSIWSIWSWFRVTLSSELQKNLSSSRIRPPAFWTNSKKKASFLITSSKSTSSQSLPVVLWPKTLTILKRFANPMRIYRCSPKKWNSKGKNPKMRCLRWIQANGWAGCLFYPLSNIGTYSIIDTLLHLY